MPPMQADKMKPKLDVVVVSIYAAMGIVDCGSDWNSDSLPISDW